MWRNAGLLTCALGGVALGCPDIETSRTPVVVFAASSLTESLEAVVTSFERTNKDLEIRLVFAGSQVLRLQIEQGAAADVFMSANPDHVDALIRAGLITEAPVFAQNELVVIVPNDNPAAIRSFADLPLASRLVIGSDRVPVGRYTRQLFENAEVEFGSVFMADVRRHVVSEENNVRLVRAKVELGEADAAIVYRTDAAGSTAVCIVEIPPPLNVRARYTIGRLVSAPHARDAARFVAYLESETGQQILARYAFIPAGDP